MSATPNPIDVVERAYDLDAPMKPWLEALLRSIAPLIDGDRGFMAYEFDMTTLPARWLESGVTIDFDVDLYDVLQAMMGSYDRADVNRFQVAPTTLTTLGQTSKQIGVADPRKHPEFARLIAKLGAVDMAAYRTVEPRGKGLAFCAPQRRDRSFDPRVRRLWAKVAAHVAAGHRLRDRLASATGTGAKTTAARTSEAFDAVLTPSGKLEHAEGETKHGSTREALRTAVQRQERARGRARREDPEAATTMWTALVAGRWSLVDHFESGGRRYIVARRNEHGGPDPRALGARERDVAQLAALGKSNKLIAYELGIAESTVASHLSSAMRKLGVKTRVELLRMLMQLAQA
ncbi:MAG TPA: helix-turn-helix transcriptional regulator [Kofleriaceae bacterium]|nr:helix-turn-helix transcriptional regulator [Kofleriaceae bacterium]